MAKINTRSPYFINYTIANLDSVVLEIYIYTGAPHGTITGVPQYTLNTTAIDEKVKFEISELVKDYIPGKNNNSYLPTLADENYSTVYVDTRLIPTVSGVAQSPIDTLALRAFLGYGYFNQGANPQNDEALLQTNTKILKPNSRNIRIGVDVELTDRVQIYNGYTLLNDVATSSTDAQNQIQYVSVDPTLDIDSYVEQLEFDGYNVETSECLENFLCNLTFLPATSAVVIKSSGESTQINIEDTNNPPWDPIRVTFRNKFGALQDLYFFGNNSQRLQTKKEQYKSNITTDSGYQTWDPQEKLLTKNGTESITLNSGYYPESYNEVFKQLLLSEQVWIFYEDYLLGAVVKSSSLKYKNRLSDMLINYTIDFDFAFDTINNIR
jgi:hypothetical protein